ncbi:MAG: hypothetical protein AB8B85_14425 [Paracoccaceae bacterium]
MGKLREPKACWAIALVVCVIVAWLINWYVGATTGQLARGINGDMFGAVNALFTGLAFAGVIFAIRLQRYEVRLLQDELARTKDIMEKQSDGLDEQNRSSRIKSFEDTFFALLSTHNDILNSIDLQGKHQTVGIDVFAVLNGRLKSPHEWKYENFYNKGGNEIGQ